MKTLRSDKTDASATYDYVVAGAGSAGCAVAAGLAQAGHSVCLIEAGGQGDGLVTRMPLANAFQVPHFPAFNNWAYRTEPKVNLNGRRGYQPRGKCVGGSSAINGMIYLRGRPQDFDRWDALGCSGWSWDHVLPFFQALEHTALPDSTIYGHHGPVHISECQSHTEADALFFKAAKQAGFAFIDDFNEDHGEGVGPFRFTQYANGSQRRGRCSSAAFLRALPRAQRPTIQTKVLIDQLLVEHDRVVGVLGIRDGQTLQINARHEVILSAGAFGSPAILQRSGFGAPDVLAPLGIDVREPIAEVGADLQDHLQCGLHYRCNDRRFMGLTVSGTLELAKAAMTWRRTGKGWGSTCFTQSGGYWKTDPDLVLPDIQCHFFSGIVHDHGNRLHPSRGFSAHVYVLDPESRGSVEIASADPRVSPVIDPASLSSARDLSRLKTALKQLQRVLVQPAFQELAPKAIKDISTLNDAAIEHFIRQNADTAYHPAGTCRMGSDEGAVVDTRLRFRSARGLRIADASIMPTLIGANTNATSMMIGTRAAAFILEDQNDSAA